MSEKLKMTRRKIIMPAIISERYISIPVIDSINLPNE
jgi:hypothetical protein